MQNGTRPQISTEQKRFQGRSQLELGLFLPFRERPRSGHVPVRFLLPRPAEFEPSHATSPSERQERSEKQADANSKQT